MKRISDTVSAFSLVELLIVVAVVGILIFLAKPNVTICVDKARMTETLGNARSMQQATTMMTLDQIETAGGAVIDWTSAKSRFLVRPLPLSTYFDALVRDGYMTKSELRKVLTAPGKGPGRDEPPTAENICFTFFQVRSDSPSDQPMLVTVNWRDRQLTDHSPYRKKNGFVVFNKGGGGGVYKRQQDASSTNIFPRAGENENGAVYSYVPLK